METGMITSNAANAALTAQQRKAPKSGMDKDSFLKLLVAQLSNQDPTQSQDPNQMVQQMTSFSTLEQAQNTNALLEGLQKQTKGLFETQAAGLVGKKVRVSSESFDLKDGKATVGLDLAADANVSILIKDLKGNTVAKIEKGRLSAGASLVEWDGKDASGNDLPAGTYTAAISAKDSTGKDVAARTSVYARVDAVTFLQGMTFVKAGGRTFNLSDINEVAA